MTPFRFLSLPPTYTIGCIYEKLSPKKLAFNLKNCVFTPEVSQPAKASSKRLGVWKILLLTKSCVLKGDIWSQKLCFWLPWKPLETCLTKSKADEWDEWNKFMVPENCERGKAVPFLAETNFHKVMVPEKCLSSKAYLFWLKSTADDWNKVVQIDGPRKLRVKRFLLSNIKIWHEGCTSWDYQSQFWTPNYFNVREFTAERIVLEVHYLNHLTDSFAFTTEKAKKIERRQTVRNISTSCLFQNNAIGRSLLTKTNVKWSLFCQVKRRLDWKLMKSKHKVIHLVSKLSAFFQELSAFDFFNFFWSENKTVS